MVPNGRDARGLGAEQGYGPSVLFVPTSRLGSRGMRRERGATNVPRLDHRSATRSCGTARPTGMVPILRSFHPWCFRKLERQAAIESSTLLRETMQSRYMMFCRDRFASSGSYTG